MTPLAMLFDLIERENPNERHELLRRWVNLYVKECAYQKGLSEWEVRQRSFHGKTDEYEKLDERQIKHSLMKEDILPLLKSEWHDMPLGRLCVVRATLIVPEDK